MTAMSRRSTPSSSGSVPTSGADDLMPSWCPVFVREAAAELRGRRYAAHPPVSSRARRRRNWPAPTSWPGHAGPARPELRMRKWDSSPGRRTPVRPLRHDEFGHRYLWPGRQARALPSPGPREPTTATTSTHSSSPRRLLDPPGGAPTRTMDLYCDVTTRPVVEADAVRAVDLDLDVRPLSRQPHRGRRPGWSRDAASDGLPVARWSRRRGPPQVALRGGQRAGGNRSAPSRRPARHPGPELTGHRVHGAAREGGATGSAAG
ncbi:DUF402 domain-containing protein [Pseudonocardia sp. MCCB 268]|nr:DUF402 domain-containing protein [Pseudonocardia cytotoxica]